MEESKETSGITGESDSSSFLIPCTVRYGDVNSMCSYNILHDSVSLA